MSTRAGAWSFGSCGEPLDPPVLTNGVECATPAYLRAMRELEAEGDAEYVIDAARIQVVDVTPVSRDRRLADDAAVPLFGELP